MLKKFIMPLFAVFSLFVATSCEESEEVSEYDNWASRNGYYVDSIATLARSGANGWKQIPAYTMGDNIGEDASVSQYIYVKNLENGTGDYSPQSGDTVRVHYEGRLIPTESKPEGLVFDKSYNKQELDENTDVPALLTVKGTVVGFATSLMHMVQGDHWQVVIPQYLGYGNDATGSIPAYSTLIFKIKLAKVYRNGDNNDTSWH